MNIYEWIQQFAENAIHNNDVQRLQLVYLLQTGDTGRQTQPEIAYTTFKSGRDLAEQLSEHCWVMLFAHRMAHVCIFELEDLDRALSHVTRDYVLSNQDQYVHCPINPAIRLNLIETYLYYDPVGYSETIQNSIEHLRKTTNHSNGIMLQLDDFLAQLYLKLNQLDEALDYALRTLDSGYGFLTLTRIYWERGDYDNALELSLVRLEQSSYAYDRADAGAWVAALMMRQEQQSQNINHLYQYAINQLRSINFVPNSTLFDALAEYQELIGNGEEALAIRNTQIQRQNLVAGPEEYAIVRLRRARLLGRLNKREEMDSQITEIRKYLHRFQFPPHYERLIELIEGGYYSDVVWQQV